MKSKQTCEESLFFLNWLKLPMLTPNILCCYFQIWIYFCNGKLASVAAERECIARKEAFGASTFLAFEL